MIGRTVSGILSLLVTGEVVICHLVVHELSSEQPSRHCHDSVGYYDLRLRQPHHPAHARAKIHLESFFSFTQDFDFSLHRFCFLRFHTKTITAYGYCVNGFRAISTYIFEACKSLKMRRMPNQSLQRNRPSGLGCNRKSHLAGSLKSAVLMNASDTF